MPQPTQPVTDDSIQVRQLSHYQFTWIAGEPGAAGTWTLQLVLDQGAWEEVLTVDPDDADNLQECFRPRRSQIAGVRASRGVGTTVRGEAILQPLCLTSLMQRSTNSPPSSSWTGSRFAVP